MSVLKDISTFQAGPTLYHSGSTAPPLTCKENIASQFVSAIITTERIYIALNVPKLCTISINLLRLTLV
jgi:hypothetical protein